MTEKEIYLQNRNRVFEIYGINPNNKNYNCHHIICKHDRGDLVPLDYDIDQVSNLIPIKKTDHEELHHRLDFNDKLFELQRADNWKFQIRKKHCKKR